METRWQSQPSFPKGILCGADQAQEWLLPWWWSRLRDCNEEPVAFCDLGMSEEALRWCRERGEVIAVPFDPSVVVPKDAIPPEQMEQWEQEYASQVWDLRQAWFKKPFAILHSPFQRTLWLDLDCEVLGPIDVLFDLCLGESKVGVMRDFYTTHLPRFHRDAHYNGGVIICEHGAPLMEKWAEACVRQTDRFWGDDFCLSHVINTQQIPVEEISDLFNWRVSQGININAIIYHWNGPGGKTVIREFGGFKPTFDTLFKRGR